MVVGSSDGRACPCEIRQSDAADPTSCPARDGIAPVMEPAMTADSLAHIDVPVRMVVGSADNQAVPIVNAEPIAARVPGSALEVLPG